MSALRLGAAGLGFAAFALSVRTLEPWAGVAFLGLIALFVLAGAATAPDWLLGVPGALARGCCAGAAGLGLAIVLFSASALATQSTGLGSLVLLALAALGSARIWRQRAIWSDGSETRSPDGAVLSVALVLGLYLVGYNEIVEGDHLGYTYRWDWDSHLFWAQLVAERGLPLIGSAGSVATPFAALTHTGHLGLIAGAMQLGQLGPYGAARSLGVLCFGLLAVLCLTLVEQPTRSPRLVAFAALAALVWGGLGLPVDLLRGNREGVLDPYYASAFPLASASGALYHNLTQLLSLPLAAAALLAIRRGGQAGGGFAWAGLLLGASGLVKPSTALVLAPGVALLAACAAQPFRALGSLAAGLLPSAALYFAPAWMAALPLGRGFEIVQPTTASVARLAVFVGAGGLLVASRLSGWPARLRSGSVLEALALAVCVGAAVDGFVTEPALAGYGNKTWGLAAALTLFAPHVVVAAFETARPPLRWALLAVVGLHLASGTLYAARYPWLRWREVQIDVRRSLFDLRSISLPRDAFLVDSWLTPQAAAPYLARPAPLPLVNLIQAAEIADRDLWLQISKGESLEKLSALLPGRAAVVLGPRTKPLRGALRAAGWRRDPSFVSEDYELWRPLRKP